MASLTQTDLYDPAQRLDPRGPVAKFLTTVLANKSHVLDAAAGNGCDSVMLFRHGHSVVCNELNAQLLGEAKELADEHGAQIEFTSFRWETLHDLLDPMQKFDAIILTRNAFAMSEPIEQRRALENFLNRLNPSGVLLIDERTDAYSENASTDSEYHAHPFEAGDLFAELLVMQKPIDIYVDLELAKANAEEPISQSGSVTTYVIKNA